MPATLDEFFASLSWSLAAFQKGKWPETNHLGQRYSPDSNEGKLAGTLLADGFCAILWCLVGDLEYMNSVLKLPHYATTTILGRIAGCQLIGCPCNGNQQRPLEGFLWNLQQFVFSSSFKNGKS